MKHLFHILSLVLLLLAFSACTAAPSSTEDTVDTPNAAQTTENAHNPTDPLQTTGVGYPYDVILDNGNTVTLTLEGSDPAYHTELHLAALDDTDILNRVVLHKEAGGTGICIEHAYVLDGETGEELPVTAVDEVLSQFVSVSVTDDAWILTVSGVEHRIEKAQFADYPAEQIWDVPVFSQYNDFYMENGQLYCNVGILCAGMGTGYAAESLRIRYGYENGAIVPAEITFLKTESIPNAPVTMPVA